MNIEGLHRGVTYLVVISASAPIFVSADLPGFLTAAYALAVFASWFTKPRAPGSDLTSVAWNALTLAALVALILRVSQGNSPITAGILFLLFLLLNKLFNRRSIADDRQVQVVSFLVLIATTTLSSGLIFAVSFLAYFVFVGWSMALTHLLQDVQTQQMVAHDPGALDNNAAASASYRHTVKPGLFVRITALSLCFLVLSVGLLALFPRVGFGLMSSFRRRGPLMSGFQDEVKLGDHGRVRNNPQVVFRVKFPSNRRPLMNGTTLRWKGSVFDSYRRGRWRHGSTTRHWYPPLFSSDGLFVVAKNGKPSPRWLREHSIEQEIYLEPINSTILFAADRPVALADAGPTAKHKLQPRRGPLGELRSPSFRTAGIRYQAYSSPNRPDRSQLEKATLEGHVDFDEGSYLQLPDELPKRVGKLAREIIRRAQAKTPYEKVRAVFDYLRNTYRYSLDLRHDKSLEPLDEFLFVTKQGHCEYFATAMAILLRTLGIPTRHITGFAGGQWNAFGQFLAVRHQDAHAWVEAYMGKLGWVSFDPTPPRGLADMQQDPAALFSQVLDAVRLRWFTYVVEYDLEKQVALYRSTRRVFRKRSWSSFGAPLEANPKGWLWGVVIACLLFTTVILLLKRYGKSSFRNAFVRFSPKSATRATHLYKQALKKLERRGARKSSTQTAIEFCTQLQAQGHMAAEPLRQITDLYYRIRFGWQPGASTPDAENLLQRLDQAIGQLDSLPLTPGKRS